MIGHLRGVLLAKHPNQALLECAGVGYDVAISVATFSDLPAEGAEARLHIYTRVAEDQLALYGFSQLQEKRLFERLLTISGIGPKLAITVLSGVAADRLVAAIRAGRSRGAGKNSRHRKEDRRARGARVEGQTGRPHRPPGRKLPTPRCARRGRGRRPLGARQSRLRAPGGAEGRGGRPRLVSLARRSSKRSSARPWPTFADERLRRAADSEC